MMGDLLTCAESSRHPLQYRPNVAIRLDLPSWTDDDTQSSCDETGRPQDDLSSLGWSAFHHRTVAAF